MQEGDAGTKSLYISPIRPLSSRPTILNSRHRGWRSSLALRHLRCEVTISTETELLIWCTSALEFIPKQNSEMAGQSSNLYERSATTNLFPAMTARKLCVIVRSRMAEVQALYRMHPKGNHLVRRRDSKPNSIHSSQDMFTDCSPCLYVPKTGFLIATKLLISSALPGKDDYGDPCS
jgi:hypothetical protein